MEALKKNKFLTTYLGVLVGGALILGWFLWSSYSKHKSARGEYDSTLGAVQALEGRPLYPNPKNLQSRKAQVDGYAAKVSELHNAVLAYQKPINESPDETKFQNRLTEIIKDIKLQAEFTKLGSGPTPGGADFDLGMGRYLTEIPRRDTVPHLEFQLDGIKRLVDIMLTDRVATIDSITRHELSVESETPAVPPRGAAAATTAKKPTRPAAAGPALPEDKVLKRYPFTVRMTGSARSIEDVMNHVASSKEHFFATRQLRVENEKKVGPPKGETTASSSDSKDKKDSTVVLGGEKVTASLDIDLIRFLPPEAAPKPPTAADK
jgi:hypothetical protein